MMDASYATEVVIYVILQVCTATTGYFIGRDHGKREGFRIGYRKGYAEGRHDGETMQSLKDDAKYQRLAAACEEFRDMVLHQRGPLAENGMDNDQVNDVLGAFDDTIGQEIYGGEA